MPLLFRPDWPMAQTTVATVCSVGIPDPYDPYRYKSLLLCFSSALCRDTAPERSSCRSRSNEYGMSLPSTQTTISFALTMRLTLGFRCLQDAAPARALEEAVFAMVEQRLGCATYNSRSTGRLSRPAGSGVGHPCGDRAIARLAQRTARRSAPIRCWFSRTISRARGCRTSHWVNRHEVSPRCAWSRRQHRRQPGSSDLVVKQIGPTL